MRLMLVQLAAFTKKWAKLGLNDDDLMALESLLIVNPVAGVVIPGTGGLRKIRFAPPSWHVGKRAATRMILRFHRGGRSRLSLHALWEKRQSDLSADEKKVFRQVLERLHDRYARSSQRPSKE